MLEELQFRIRIPLEGKPDPTLAIQVYAFTREGKFLESVPVTDGVVTVKINPDRMPGTQVYLGPALRKGDVPTLALMQKMHAYKPKLHQDPLTKEWDVLPIPQAVWQFWCLHLCHVRGRVVKPVETAGIVENKAICHARVHICEVDRLLLILYKLPEQIIWNLRDEVLHLIDERMPRPVVRPIPHPDPGPLREIMQTPIVSQALNPIANLKTGLRMTQPAVELTEALVMPKAPLAPLAAKLQPLLQAPSIQTVRKALVDHIELIQPYFCYFPWFWPFITRCDEITTVFTDNDGQFETSFLYWSCVDKPDLYFWVEFCVGGTWTTVYRKGVPCNTYWNYANGTEITIEITDPRVPFCEPPKTVDGMKVAVLTIGDAINVTQMVGGLTLHGEPLGGSLEPHVWFGDGLAAAGITKYRWSYRRQGTADWHVADQQVLRHYAVIRPDDTVVFRAAVMGPEGDQQLFKIQPATAPEGGVWVPAVNSRLNTASAHFRSDLLGNPLSAAGLYELKLELFTEAGALVDPVAAGVEFLVPTDMDAPFTAEVTTQLAPDTFFVTDESGHKAFCLTLRVDNNPCQAEIYPVSVGGHAAGECGFIEYASADPVHVSFKADHPNDFATFNFYISKGSTGNIEWIENGEVAAPSVDATHHVGLAHAYVQSAPGIFVADVSSAGLIGSCTGARAAFCETLYVYAKATDGFGRLYNLDRSGIPVAFALVPAEV